MSYIEPAYAPSKDDLRNALAVLRAEYAYAHSQSGPVHGYWIDAGTADLKKKIDWIRLQLSEV